MSPVLLGNWRDYVQTLVVAVEWNNGAILAFLLDLVSARNIKYHPISFFNSAYGLFLGFWVYLGLID
jgi:hypothetical protein